MWVSLYAIAMAYLEAAVVVYLRALEPGNAALARVLGALPAHIVGVETGREAATLVMLAAVAMLAGRDRWTRLLHFALAFALWDFFYYVFLRLLIGWPPGLFTWDVLFLIPVPWTGPVLAPLLVDAALAGGALALVARAERGVRPGLPARAWAGAVAGAVVIVLSFTLDWRYTAAGDWPPAFRWWLFAAGLALAVAAVTLGARARERRRTG